MAKSGVDRKKNVKIKVKVGFR